MNALSRAARALDDAGVGGSAVRAASDHLAAPGWRVAVVGRVSAGRSSLVNALAGRRVQPMGLGGVTRAPAEVAVGGATVVDTPGIDAADRAIGVLAPILDEVDAVVWVVDGLQPVTDTERRVLRTALPPGTPLHVVVSRLDVVPDDADDVLARVRTEAAAFAPRSVRRLDLRHATRAPDALLAPITPSPRRLRAARAALVQASEALDALPPVPDPDAVRARWREVVRDVETRVLSRPGAREQVLRRMVREATVARDAFADALPGCPSLPAPEVPTGRLLDRLSGPEATRRAVRAALARLLLDGEIALTEWLADSGLADAHARRLAARDAVGSARDAVGSALDAVSRPGCRPAGRARRSSTAPTAVGSG